VCNIYFENGNKVPDEINQQVLKAIENWNRRSVRSWAMRRSAIGQRASGAKFSMPGMMNTILNLALNDVTVEGLAEAAAIRASPTIVSALHSDVRRSRAGHRHGEVRPHLRRAQAQGQGKARHRSQRADLQAIIADYKKLVQKETKKPFPQDPHEQLAMSRDAVFRSWWNPKAAYYRKMEKIPDEIGTGASVQAMVFGNTGDNSATGVGFTRDPGSGERVFYGEFLINAQGEDVVAGIRTPSPISELENVMPAAYRQLARDHRSLEKHYRDMQDFEFTIEEGTLYMLQNAQREAHGSGRSAVAVEMVEEGPDR
jgi:pyruvate,orthophosphate dikinase